LVRHAAGNEEASLADVERETANRADRVVENLGGRWQHRLLLVNHRHYTVTPAKKFSMNWNQPALSTSLTPAARDQLRPPAGSLAFSSGIPALRRPAK